MKRMLYRLFTAGLAALLLLPLTACGTGAATSLAASAGPSAPVSPVEPSACVSVALRPISQDDTRTLGSLAAAILGFGWTYTGTLPAALSATAADIDAPHRAMVAIVLAGAPQQESPYGVDKLALPYYNGTPPGWVVPQATVQQVVAEVFGEPNFRYTAKPAWPDAVNGNFSCDPAYNTEAGGYIYPDTRLIAAYGFSPGPEGSYVFSLEQRDGYFVLSGRAVVAAFAIEPSEIGRIEMRFALLQRDDGTEFFRFVDVRPAAG